MCNRFGGKVKGGDPFFTRVTRAYLVTCGE